MVPPYKSITRYVVIFRQVGDIALNAPATLCVVCFETKCNLSDSPGREKDVGDWRRIAGDSEDEKKRRGY